MVALMRVPSKRGARVAALMARRAAGPERPPPDWRSSLRSATVSDGADGFDVDQFVDAVAAARGVALGDQCGA